MGNKFQTSYDRIRVPEENKEASLTAQEFKKECDVGYIMDRFAQTGMIGDPRVQKRMYQFLDCTKMSNFDSARQLVINAQQAFDRLPEDIKKMFNYKISNFNRACNDPQMLDVILKAELERRGIKNVGPKGQPEGGKGGAVSPPNAEGTKVPTQTNPI